MKKIIITSALVGSVPQKKDTPYVPITPEEISQDAYECFKVGASVVHVHARDKDGKSVHDLEIFREIHDKIKEKAPDLIVQISTGGRAGLTFDSRGKGLLINPEMASLSTGSCNFPKMVYENSPELIKDLAEEMKKRKIKPELEIFDTSMIQPALDLFENGLIKKPLYFNFVMGLKGAQSATVSQLSHLLSMIPEKAEWNISGVGKYQLLTTYLGIALGGHVRVGLEDNIYYSKGKLATNVQLVERAVRLAKEYGRDVATPSEAREILGL
ncbi:MAG: 3-keto-5-aminohexanoate cleavage protein [Eubacteriales bacterium]